MSKKSDYKQEKNPLLVVLYIAAVLLLLGCIAFFVLSSKERQKTYEEQIRQAAENETEYIMTERIRETEAETEAPQEKTKSSGADTASPSKTTARPESEKKPDGSKTESEETSGQTLPEGSESETPESDSEIESEAETAGNINISSAEKSQTVLVLNGTKKPGVAGNWKDRLEELGYRKVVSASYDGAVEDNTVIYTGTGAMIEGLRQEFQNCTLRPGKVYSGIEPGEGETLPEKVDVYVVVGRNDAVTDNSEGNE